MSLRRYVEKRNFAKTPEPKGKIASARRSIFVVQKHRASHLHYDFRLELDGVLKSWAVPKGPSMDPRVKRMAIEVEDHPVEYAMFEGQIPDGEYGAGHVIVWDIGRWTAPRGAAEQLRKGRIEFELHGEKLKGRWLLVRTKTSSSAHRAGWLLIKRSDRWAAREDLAVTRPESVVSGLTIDELMEGRRSRKRKSLPRPRARARPRRFPAAFVPPQLATLASEPPDGDDWVHELKFDGYRAICRMEEEMIGVRTRSGLDWSGKFPWLVRECRKLPVASATIDGEIVALVSDEADARPSFSSLQAALSGGTDRDLVYYAFDLLSVDGEDLRELPLVDRKKRLKALVERAGSDRIRYSEHWKTAGRRMLRASCGMKMEGIVSKRADAPYASGRSKDWIKTKCSRRQEFVIGGFATDAGSSRGFRSLLLGSYVDGKLVYAGRVGTGFGASARRELAERMRKHAARRSPFSGRVSGFGDDLHWLEPALVAEIEYAEKTADGILRHASFKGLREDKPAEEVVAEEPMSTQLTNPGRVLWRNPGITKRDLASYYETIEPLLMPHLKSRPLALLRCPDGFGSGCFFQKHGEREIIGAEGIDDVLKLVQMSALELHAQGCRLPAADLPDLMVFDLDPAEGLAWRAVVTAALELRETLSHLGLESFVKTTGGKGLHLHVPVKPVYSWPEIKSFTKAIATRLAMAEPDRFTASISKAKRKGRIFIDYLRNGEGATAVAPYSPRAKDGAPVAMPVAWRDLARIESPAELSLREARASVRKRRTDPWKDFFSSRNQRIAVLDRARR